MMYQGFSFKRKEAFTVKGTFKILLKDGSGLDASKIRNLEVIDDFFILELDIVGREWEEYYINPDDVAMVWRNIEN